jgi:hypothetical protein
MPDAPWVAHEWLGEVLLAWLFDHFGGAGLTVVTALCVAAALALLLRHLLHVLLPVLAVVATIAAAALAYPHVLARPHIFTLPLLVIWVGALVAARSGNQPPSLWLVPLMTLWANLHGGYISGLALAALFAAEAVVVAADWPRRLQAAWGWGLFIALAIIAALATPFGLDGLLLPLRLTQMSYAMSQLVEWRGANFQSFGPLEPWLMGLLLAVLSFGWRVPLTRVFLLLLVLHMALRHIRFGELLGFVAPLLLAPALAPQLAEALASRPASSLDRGMAELAKPPSALGLALAVVLLAAVSGAMLRSGLGNEAAAITPKSALAAVRMHHIEGPVLNDYAFGGYLILSGIPPFIDGRAELYGDAFIKRYVEAMLVQSDQLPSLLDRYGITWTLIDPNRPAALLLDHLHGWRRVYADDTAVVHMREAGVTEH